MTQFTWNRGLGVPAPYNDSDFTTEYTGPAVGQWTWNRGLGWAGPYNDSDFTTEPGTPGGDVEYVESLTVAGITAEIVELSGIDVVAYVYGGIEAETTTAGLTYTLADVDSVRVEWRAPYVTRVEWR